MKLFKILCLGAVSLAAAFAPLRGAVAQEVLRFSNWLPPTHYIVQEMLIPWAADVEQATEGRVKVEFINALGKPPAHLDLVRNGVADMGMSVHSYTANRFPLIEFAELPLTTEDGEVNSVAYWRTYDKFMKDAGEHRGVKLLGLWTSPATVIFTTKESLDGLDSLRGLKLRSPSPLFDTIGQKLHFVTVNAPASESYEMLSRGVIDGMYFQYDQIENFKLDRLIRSALQAPGGFGKSSQYMFMNERKWNRLSEADRAAIEKLSGEHIARAFGGKWNESEQQSIKRLAEAGLKTTKLEGAELEALRGRLQSIEDDWIATADKKGVDGKAALQYYREQIAELEKEKAEKSGS
ncbi:TRAP transporter substrate-binding protein [Kerstersia gyiorum]|jgi:TRAP-type C4-dicarboxylate transport system substrate-binding protein|uniref:TRAP transporter substrate-binding protein n=1 Tax=Kerstersia gyiorum TaxID=206506 RepID=UPI00242D045C|nr:TRAP transporter substrate-binding protein [Kerstersia gyiorum]MCH4272278.1 TRAP transporter substrate-binding protein [Kerstersia gyiorum]MCI1229223.1 TRAP transporter substrate-binding protein [Kerstersia gyiorum]